MQKRVLYISKKEKEEDVKLYFKGKNIDEMSKEELVKVIRWFYAHNIIIVEQFREEEDEG